jgi:ABC-2 type transport system ATP-binding protein
MTAVLESSGLGKRYRRRWALTDCTLAIPAGHVVGLVGPNGAGKTTLLNLAVGMLTPTAGTIEVLGGARMNPGWDADLARHRVEQLGLDPAQKAGKLSGGQRAQLALTLAVAKRPELLILDEPIASLDPLARREFLQVLMGTVAEHEVSVVMSSHLVADLERVCDYLIVLVASRVRIAGQVEDLLASHRLLTGARCDPATLPADWQVVSASHTDRQSTLLVRTSAAVHDPAWTVERVGMEDLVLAYMSQAAAPPGSVPGLTALSAFEARR